MARRRPVPEIAGGTPVPSSSPPKVESDPVSIEKPSFWTRPKVALAVLSLLGLQAVLAVTSLRQENPTVDEIAHMPAGVSYWEKGTFKLYHHNPPLVKLVAALPVVLSHPNTAGLYEMTAWDEESQSAFGHYFAEKNIANYFELFDRARLMMPLFLVLGGLVVFAWSSRLYGAGGGLLSLALWTLCPNILAHGRLVTSDAPAAAIGVFATYLFWRTQKSPAWGRVILAGLALGLAELTKFSLILLYGLWPALAVVRLIMDRERSGWARRVGTGLAQGFVMLALSLLVIDLGYAFEGVGMPLRKFEFASRALTRPVPPGMTRPTSKNDLLAGAWRNRVNRFRGTWLGSLPSPLPKHYLLGFDEQKLESEGVPIYFFNDRLPHDDSAVAGYAVYLNGELRRKGWWYFYLATLAYKVPEGTWALVLLSSGVLIFSRRSRAPWADEVTVLAVPVCVLVAMSTLTDICLGLRYILPIFPFVFISLGKVVPWASGLAGHRRWVGMGLIGASLLGTLTASASIYPSYLAYFNWASGGPERGSERLIDSNLDWGQDLVTLNRWLKLHHPGQKMGLAYFGQINPSLLSIRGEGFEWFLPPALPGKIEKMPGLDAAYLVGPARRLTPGLYAVSASVVRGLPWRFYDSNSLRKPYFPWMPAWNAQEDAFGYFRELTPVARVGCSIFVYEVSAEDCARLAPRWTGATLEKKADRSSDRGESGLTRPGGRAIVGFPMAMGQADRSPPHPLRLPAFGVQEGNR